MSSSINKPPIEDSSPSVISYRVGQFEKMLETGITRLETKIDTMNANFATKNDLLEAQTDAAHEHERLWKGIIEVRETSEKTKSLVGDFPLVKKLVYGAVSMILLAVLGAVIALVVIKGN